MYYSQPKRLRIEKDNGCLKKMAKNIDYKITTIDNLCSDIWLEIFEYFETIELFTIFPRLTNRIDELLLTNNEHFYSRGFVLDGDLKFFSEEIPLHRIISLSLHEEFFLKIIDQFSKLRSLKLIGGMIWVTSILEDIIKKEIKLEQLTIVTSRVEALQKFLLRISSIISLRRLEICADELGENDVISKSLLLPSQIEQFILTSSSIIDWNSLLYILPHFSSILLLNIGLIDRHLKTIPLFFSQNLRTLSLSLLEVPFIWITNLLQTPNSIVNFKLTGLVHDENFIVNENWIRLFELAPSIVRIYVNLSLEQDKKFYYYEKFQTKLRTINLQLTCINDDDDCYQHYGNEHRWWNLKGRMIKA